EDLKEWKHISDFGKNHGAHGGVWECPDLFQLGGEGTDEEKWVLIISINPGAPNGGSGTQYFIGEFDGVRFTTDQTEAKWLDYGTDNYAGVTYNNTPNGERIFIGWMSNWDYARDTPTEKWRSAMTVPRNISLQKIGDDYFLANYPLASVDELMSANLAENLEVASGETKSLQIPGVHQCKIQFKTASKDFRLTLKNAEGESLDLAMDSKSKTLLLDRINSGKVDFQAKFGNKKHYAPLTPLKNELYEVSILLDWSSIEVFVDGGLVTLTDQIFPNQPFNQLILENRDTTQAIQNVSVRKMESVWQSE
ncbi:MAG: glycoside hydrolase family 32 protein, partial [Allomuricauda sp.]